MKKSLVVLALYLALGSEVAAFDRHFPVPQRSLRCCSGPTQVYWRTQFYDPASNIPPGYVLYRSYYTPYRYVGSQHLSEQSTTLPLGWNRYYLAARLLAPYSLIIRNSPVYTSYREPEPKELPAAARSPVTLHTIPLREIAPAPGPSRTVEISIGMTEEQVRSQLGPPLIHVVLGDTRSLVYDRLVVELDKGRVKNVAFR